MDSIIHDFYSDAKYSTRTVRRSKEGGRGVQSGNSCGSVDLLPRLCISATR